MAKRQLRENGERVVATVEHSAQAAGAEIRSWPEKLTAPVALRATTLGLVSGLRSMAPFALLDWTRKQNPPPTNDLEKFLDSSTARVLLSSLAAGELVGDKLPGTPSRISPAPLLGRLGLGALAGVSIFRRYRQPLIVGAALGALGAGVGTTAGYYAREAIASRTRIPQWMLGLAEDALTFSLGFLAVRRS